MNNTQLPISPTAATTVGQRARAERPRLTAKERRAIERAIKGATNAEVAARFRVSPQHVGRMRKELVAAAEHRLRLAGFWDELRGLAWEGRIDWQEASDCAALVSILTRPASARR